MRFRDFSNDLNSNYHYSGSLRRDTDTRSAMGVFDNGSNNDSWNDVTSALLMLGKTCNKISYKNNGDTLFDYCDARD